MARSADRAQEFERFPREHAETPHPRVDVEVDARAESEAPREILEHRAPVGGVQGDLDPMTQAVLRFFVDDRPEDEDRHTHSRGAELQRLGRIADAERRDAASDGVVRDGDRAVAVGVGLDDEHDAHAGTRAPADHGQIVGHRVEIDLGPDPVSAHGRKIAFSTGRSTTSATGFQSRTPRCAPIAEESARSASLDT